MKKGPLYLCGAAAAAVCVLYHTLAPKGVPFSPAPVPISESWTFVPLDDRPPCRRFTEELGALAGIHFAAPPHELMDWYEVPAHIPQVWDYVEKDLPGRRGALLSTDLLYLAGSCIPALSLPMPLQQHNFSIAWKRSWRRILKRNIPFSRSFPACSSVIKSFPTDGTNGIL